MTERWSKHQNQRAEALGIIGSRWPVVPLKHVLEYIEGPGIMAADFQSDGTPLLRISCVAGRYVTLDGCDYLDPALVASKWSRFQVRAHDLLISGSASTGLCAEVTEETVGAVPYTGLIIIRPRSDFDRDFARRFLLSDVFAKQVAVLRAGSAIQHFGPGHLGSMFCPVPPPTQQRAISRFLEEAVGAIDAAVGAEQRLLELLNEKRKATIATAVTRGLNPNLRLRDSDVLWLGDIPAHWDMTRLKFAARVQTGIALGKDYGRQPTSELPYLRVANVQDGFIDLAEVKTMAIPEREAASATLRRGDVLMNEGGDADKLGRGAIWDGSIDPCLHQNHVFVLRPASVTSEWLSTWTGTDFAKAYFETRAKQSTNLASISSTNLLELPIAVPPDDEQRAIVEHIACETAKCDALRAISERTIGLLEERRSVLISAAVTGQVEIRQTPSAEAVDLPSTVIRQRTSREVRKA